MRTSIFAGFIATLVFAIAGCGGGSGDTAVAPPPDNPDAPATGTLRFFAYGDTVSRPDARPVPQAEPRPRPEELRRSIPTRRPRRSSPAASTPTSSRSAPMRCSPCSPADSCARSTRRRCRLRPARVPRLARGARRRRRRALRARLGRSPRTDRQHRQGDRQRRLLRSISSTTPTPARRRSSRRRYVDRRRGSRDGQDEPLRPEPGRDRRGEAVPDRPPRQLPLASRTRDSDMANLFKSGEVVIANGGRGTAQDLIKDGVPVKWIAPKEGATSWVCGLGITSNAAEPRCGLQADQLLRLAGGAGDQRQDRLCGDEPGGDPAAAREVAQDANPSSLDNAIALTEPDSNSTTAPGRKSPRAERAIRGSSADNDRGRPRPRAGGPQPARLPRTAAPCERLVCSSPSSLLVLFGPVLMLALFSFNDSSIISLPWEGFTTQLVRRSLQRRAAGPRRRSATRSSSPRS